MNCRVVAQKMGFNLTMIPDDYGVPGAPGEYWSGFAGKTQSRTSDFGFGTCNIIQPYYSIFGFTNFFYQLEFTWVSRKPVPLTKIDNVIKVFPANIWLPLILTLSAIAVCFAAFYYAYRSQTFRHLNLVKPNVQPFDFPLLTFASLMEPDPIPWFPEYSAGKIAMKNFFAKPT